MSKLFAMENDEVVVDDQVSDAEAVSAAVTEDADLMAGDLQASADVTDGVQAGVDAIEPLEEVESLLTDVVESGEGLDKVAAEAIRIAVENICRPIGADPKRLYPLYATENFDSASARLGNSKLALEGAGEFIKETYERIKAALKRMWEKAKAFWAKHFSTLGRMKNAALSLKKKADAAKSLKATPFIEKMPSAFGAAFGPKGELTTADVAAVFEKTGELGIAVKTIYAKVDQAVEGMKVGKIKPGSIDFKIGSDLFNVEGLVGGRSIRVYTEGDTPGADDTNVNVSFKVERINEAFEYDADKGMRVANLDELKETLENGIKLIDGLMKVQKDGEKRSTKIGEALTEAASLQKNQDSKDARRLLSYGYKMATFSDKLDGIVVTEVTRMAKYLISYSAFNLAQYK